MIAQIVIGALMIVFGLFSIITGRMPFKKEYHGVKKIGLHSRIEGGAGLLAGALLMARSFVPMETTSFMIIILIICILAIIIEIVFNVFS